MTARTLDDLLAFRRAHAFKLSVYRLLFRSRDARQDWRFRSQLAEAASGGPMNVAEGFRRYVPAEFSRFLGYALSSMEEAVRRTMDGVDRGYFTEDEANNCAALGLYAIRTAGKLNTYLRSCIAEERAARKRGEPWRPKSRRTKPATTEQATTEHLGAEQPNIEHRTIRTD